MKGKRTASLSNPNVIVSAICLAGFWYFLKRASDDKGLEAPMPLRMIKFW
jgi:hypothetical protein